MNKYNIDYNNQKGGGCWTQLDLPYELEKNIISNLPDSEIFEMITRCGQGDPPLNLKLKNSYTLDQIILERSFTNPDLVGQTWSIGRVFKDFKLINLRLDDIVNIRQNHGYLINKIKLIHLDDLINQPLFDNLDPFVNLEQLALPESFNILLGDSLNNLTNLKKLIINENFGQPFGDSLRNLKKLEYLYIYNHEFNHPLGDSLHNLVNLKTLYLGAIFNQPLGDSLSKLVNLKYLQISDDFNQPLGDSFKNLVSLEKLRLYDYNIELGNSLDGLVNLKELDLMNYDLPYGTSLNNLKKLEILNITASYIRNNGGIELDFAKLPNLKKINVVNSQYM